VLGAVAARRRADDARTSSGLVQAQEHGDLTARYDRLADTAQRILILTESLQQRRRVRFAAASPTPPHCLRQDNESRSGRWRFHFFYLYLRDGLAARRRR